MKQEPGTRPGDLKKLIKFNRDHPELTIKAHTEIRKLAGNDPSKLEQAYEKYIKMTNQSSEPAKPRFWQRALNRVQDVVHDARTDQVIRVVDQAIDVAAKIGQAHMQGPVGWIGLGISGIGILRDNLPVLEEVSKKDQMLEQHDLSMKSFRLASFFYKLLIKSKKPQVLYSDKNCQYHGFYFDDGSLLAFRLLGQIDHEAGVYKELNTDLPEGKYTVSREVFTTSNFNMEVVAPFVWKGVGGNIIYLSYDNIENDFVIDSDNLSKVTYLGDKSPEKFAANVKTYQDKGISRGIVLAGPPGVGKSTFFQAYTLHTKGQMVHLAVDSMNQLHSGELRMFLVCFQPTVVLFDDVDRVNEIAKLLFVVEDIRKRYPKTLIGATVNDVSKVPTALLRPSRLGKMLAFDSPNQADRELLLIHYMKEYGVDHTTYDIKKICQQMTHSYFSHDYVRFCAEEALTIPPNEMVAYAKQLNDQVTIIADGETQRNGTMLLSNGSTQKAYTGNHV